MKNWCDYITVFFTVAFKNRLEQDARGNYIGRL